MGAASSQLGMFRRDGDPTTIDHPYVPILLSKQGERGALERISDRTWELITPFIRVVPPELRHRNEDAPPPAEIVRLAAVTGDRVIYLDAVGCPRRNRSMAPLGEPYARQIYEAAIASNLAFAPVYPFRRRDLADTIKAFASDAGAAVLVRADASLTWGGQRLDAELREEVRALGIEPRRLDGVVDLGYIPPGVDAVASTVWLVRQVATAAPWRSLVLAGTSVPDSVAHEVPDDSVTGIERRERALFGAVQAAVDVRLRFGDYAVQHPVPPVPGAVPRMRASIRYTAGDFIHVTRGGHALRELSRDAVSAEYREIANRLRLHPPFAGSDCCWGDRFIEDLAAGRRIARGQHGIRALATCHHLTVVALERAQNPSSLRSMARRRMVPESTRTASRR